MKTLHVHLVRSSEDLETAFSIRQRVFVEEQGVPESLERDEWDTTAIHVLAWMEGQAVGTARYRKTVRGTKLERFAVLPPFRNRGIGGALVTSILDRLPSGTPVYLSAQEKVIDFYRHLGFQPVGDRFMEAGIVHQKMIFRPR